MISGTAKTVTQDQMNALYAINPTPHSEKAYQVPSDPAPPIAPKKTVADSHGRVTVLVTCLYNRSGTAGVNYGAKACFNVLGKNNDGTWMDAPVFHGEATIPFRYDLSGLPPGGYYWIQPLTPNTQAKLLPSNLTL